MGPVTRPCLICEAAEGKYKCAQCNLYTCSLTCFQEHRDNHPSEESSMNPTEDAPTAPVDGAASPVQSQASSHTEEGDATQTATFERAEIADLPEYKTLTQKYPNLERLLWNIAAATDPPTSHGDSNERNNTPSGSNQGYRKTNKPWTKDLGYEKGIEVLRRTRDNPGDDRDALREYCELVRLYTARREAAISEANIRQQRAQENAKAIKDLIRAEKAG
ncbi:hypothetical protein F4804DRAFT_329945 [Jackrogersella minutella]|nr:hypothetical protein F4804DRAFT_329945 [Jackrogersella minutella]